MDIILLPVLVVYKRVRGVGSGTSTGIRVLVIRDKVGFRRNETKATFYRYLVQVQLNLRFRRNCFGRTTLQ
jgi:ketopantoate hydroxymethyltransferase